MQSVLLEGRYRLEEPIDVGATAEVWGAVDERLRRPVAIKLLHRHLIPDAPARARLEREARAVASLSHPGIVAVHDVISADGRPAIVLELVEGESLAARLARDGRLRWPEAAGLAADVADALAHAHSRGIVHRDVKPANILLDRAGRTKLADFGIAHVVADQERRVTADGWLTGTLRYLAPERLAGGEATTAGDVYALGVVLFEMVAGAPPFRAETPVELALAQRQTPRRPEGLPAAGWVILAAALAADPSDRPPDVATMATALRASRSRSARSARTVVAAGWDAPTTAVEAQPRLAVISLGGDAHRVHRPARASGRWIPVELAIWTAAIVILLGVAFRPAPASSAPLAGSSASASAAGSGRAGTAASDAPFPGVTERPTNPPTPSPTAKPAGVEVVYRAFAALVGQAEADGAIDADDARDLQELAADVLDRADGGKRKDLEKALDALDEKIESLVERARIETPELEAAILDAADQLADAATAGRDHA